MAGKKKKLVKKKASGDKPSSGKKKKSKKSKISTEEKQLLKLEKSAELLRADKYQYEHFVQVADSWLLKNSMKIMAMLQQLDTTSEGVVGYEDMKSVLFDAQCPMNEIEIHQMCKHLDYENSGDIEYKDLSQGLRWYMKKALLRDDDGELEEVSDEEELVTTDFTLARGQSAKQINKCLNCKIGLWTPPNPDVKYIDLTMMLITFADSMRRHPCHFNKIVHTSISIYGLIQLIKSEVGIQSTTITIFRDKTRSPESELAEDKTLEECGYDGRDWYNPIEHVLYYDYASEFNECPILMCDHYFQDTLRLS